MVQDPSILDYAVCSVGCLKTLRGLWTHADADHCILVAVLSWKFEEGKVRKKVFNPFSLEQVESDLNLLTPVPRDAWSLVTACSKIVSDNLSLIHI